MDGAFDFFMQYQSLAAAWASAIGTTFAAFVALWLGTIDLRQRRRDRELSANMLRHLLAGELHSVRNVATKTPEIFDRIRKDYWGDDQGKTYREIIRWTGMRFRMPSAEDKFVAIANLDEEDAKRLAWLMGEVPRIHKTMMDMADRYDDFDTAIDEVATALTERLNEIRVTIDRIGWV